MFIGHFAVGLGVKRAAPTVSLGMLFLACQLADLLWPTFVLLGIEHVEIDPGNTAFTPLRFVSYPYSHSLLSLMAWSALFGALYWLLRRSTLSAALTLAAVVLSHWLLDALTHRPDIPLTLSDTTHVGLGLWNAPTATVAVEAVMLLIGVTLYLGTTRARDRIGSVGFWALIVFLATLYAANILGPPPPSAAVVAWSCEGLWLVVLWAFWVDRHRIVNPAVS